MSEQTVAKNGLPVNIEAEQIVLGCMLVSPDATYNAAEILNVSHFSRPAHRIIYSNLIDCRKQYGSELEPALFVSHLRDTGALKSCGDEEYVLTVINKSLGASFVTHYAQQVRSKWALRKVYAIADSFSKRVLEAGQEPEAIIAEMMESLSAVTKGVIRQDFASMDDIANEVWTDLEKRREGGEQIGGIETGLPSLDRVILGMYPGELTYIGARPGRGKSALAVNNIAAHNGRLGKPGAIFSLEMSKRQLGQRMFADVSGVSIRRMLMDDLGDSEWASIVRAVEELRKYPIYVCAAGGLRVDKMWLMAQRARIEKKIEYLIVDYIQLAKVEGKKASREQEVAEISRVMKSIAIDLDIPVIALAQLGRQVDQRTPPTPRLDDFRESGSIEQDADRAIAIWWPDGEKADDDGKPLEFQNAELIALKGRQFGTGLVRAMFNGPRFKFVECDTYHDLTATHEPRYGNG